MREPIIGIVGDGDDYIDHDDDNTDVDDAHDDSDGDGYILHDDDDYADGGDDDDADDDGMIIE